MRRTRYIIIDGKKKRTYRSYYYFKKLYGNYYFNRKTRVYLKGKQLKEQIKAKEKQIKKRQIIKERIRKQVAINYRLREEPYFISIRAITINPDITEKGLLLVVRKYHQQFQKQFDMPMGYYTGYETKKIPNSEDTRLNDYKIHIEILIKNKIQSYKE